MNINSTKEDTSIYSAVPGEDHFSIERVSLISKQNGTVWVDRKPVSPQEMYRQLEFEVGDRITQRSGIFPLACLVIMAGDADQRNLLQRITSPRTRNIPFKIKTVKEYLKKYMKLTNKQFDEAAQEAFCLIKKRLGFPEKDPLACSYKVTEEVIAAAKSEPCIQFLESQQPRPAIFPREFELLSRKLNEEYSTDAKDVIAALKDTKSREHIAAMSISTEEGQSYLSIANVDKQHLRLESWKWLKLVELAGQPLTLHVYEKKRRDAPTHPFRFNANMTGEVSARINLEKSLLEVLCLQEGSRTIQDKATFILDSTYALCVYITLKRLREDRERFTRLWEEAQCLPTPNDLFDKIYQPMNY
jgi:hypothetical protein